MELLPIGSVILLQGADKRLMIYGIKQINEEDGKVYDYVGCLYPEGHIGEDYTFLFQHKDIARIDYIGFIDAEHQGFRAALQKEINKQEEKVFK